MPAGSPPIAALVLPVEVDQFVVQAENAFRDAHHITDLIDKGTPSPERLAELDKIRGAADGHFKAVVKAFDEDVARLTTEPLPSNWHALDNALTVPFIPAQRRGELLGFLRHVSHQLEVNRQQPDGSQVAPPRTREVAARSGRLALALLGETTPDRPHLPPNPDTTALRIVGDQIGERFRALAKDARDRSDRSARAPSSREGIGAPWPRPHSAADLPTRLRRWRTRILSPRSSASADTRSSSGRPSARQRRGGRTSAPPARERCPRTRMTGIAASRRSISSPPPRD